MTHWKEQIKNLKESGLSFTEIHKQLGCSKGLLSYHLGIGQREKTKQRQIKFRQKAHPYLRKLDNFLIKREPPQKRKELHKFKKLIQCKLELFVRNRKTGEYMKPPFTIDDVINKFGENPKCYLTGDDIDIYQPRTYNFDHIIPVSRGGLNTLDNMGICTKKANSAKSDMTPEEFIDLCKKVLKYNKADRLGTAPSSHN